jgi:hypothetical protein
MVYDTYITSLWRNCVTESGERRDTDMTVDVKSIEVDNCIEKRDRIWRAASPKKTNIANVGIKTEAHRTQKLKEYNWRKFYKNNMGCTLETK